MENKVFLAVLIIFAGLDIYKFIKKDINFFSLLDPLVSLFAINIS